MLWSGALFLALWVILVRHLSGEWSVNEQYNYGWFVPFFALYLAWLRWETRPVPCPPPASSRRNLLLAALGLPALLILLPVRLFEIGNPDWRPLGWLHAAAVVLLTALAIWSAGGLPWLRHFAFPLCFMLVAVPWISGVEQPIVQGLMRGVAATVSEVMGLLGVPAELEGNLIRVRTGLVGVSEACSGVRSLQTSLMIGLLFGELNRLGLARRVTLLVGAVAIALVANFTRAFFLVWMAATRNVTAVPQWHDLAGYLIVGAVFAGSVALATLLGRGSKPAPPIENRTRSTTARPLGTAWLIAALACVLVTEVVAEAWYRAQETDLVARIRWTLRWPETAPGFRELHIADDVRSTLRFDEGREAVWPIANPSGVATDHPGSCFAFLFRWQPGSSTILRARAHRPDICLPSIGWRQASDSGVRNYPIAEDLALPFRHFSFVRDSAGPQHAAYAHAFFCLREDAVAKTPNAARQFDLNTKTPTDWSIADRWKVVRDGLRNPGQQVLEIVFVTPQDCPGAAAEAELGRLLRGLVATTPTR